MVDRPRLACVVDAERLQTLAQTEADYRSLRGQIAALREQIICTATEYDDPGPNSSRLDAGIMQLMALQDFYRKVCKLTPSASELEASRYAISDLQNSAGGRKPGTAIANASWQRDNLNQNLMKIFAAFALCAQYRLEGGRSGQLKRAADNVVAAWPGAVDLEAYDLQNCHKPRTNVATAARLIALRKEIIIKERSYPLDSDEAMAVKTCREQLSAAEAMPEPLKSNRLMEQCKGLLRLAEEHRRAL